MRYTELKLALYESVIGYDNADKLIQLIESSNDEDTKIYVETALKLIDTEAVTEAPKDKEYGLHRNVTHGSIAVGATAAATAISLNKKIDRLKTDIEVLIDRIDREKNKDKKLELSSEMVRKKNEIKMIKKEINALVFATGVSSASALINGYKMHKIGRENDGKGKKYTDDGDDYWEY